MADSKLRQLRKILEKPVPPAHIQQQYRVPSWHERLWDAIRPPAAVPTHRKPLSTSQRRLLWISIVAIVPLAGAWFAYDYISNAPLRANREFEAGMARLGPNDFAGAIQHFTAALKIAETSDSYFQRGNAHKNLGHFDQALADWSRAIELDPNQAGAYTARGAYYQSENQAAKALADFERSLQLNPTVDGYFQRGQLYAVLGQFDRAIEDYDRAIAERRDAPWIYLARSTAKRALGDQNGYRRDQERAAELQRH
jgi:tetratricopeptide (TPR) repeat protein